MKKAIIFDLDETLRRIEQMDNQEVAVLLRPGINKLLQRLSEVKENAVDILIWTSAKTSTINQNFINYLPNEYQKVFDTIIGRENYPKINPNTKELKIYGFDTSNKAVTALDYDQILFFDDNNTEKNYLRRLYDDTEEVDFKSPSKAVTFVSLPYLIERPSYLYALKELGRVDSEIQEKVDSFFEMLLNEPGCDIMLQIIDEFINKEKQIGLECICDNEQLKEYNYTRRDMYSELYHLIRDKGLEEKYFSYIEEYKKGKYKENKYNQDIDVPY